MIEDQAIEGFRLSPQQKRLWALQERDGTYHTQSSFVAEGELDRERLRRSFQQAVSRHEVFRTIFHRLAGMDLPIQVVQEELPIAYGELELPETGDQEAVSQELLRRDREAGLDLENGPLVRMTLARLGPERHLLCLTTPTLCGDARTHDNLIGETGLFYGAAGDEAEVGAALQYVDFSEWQHDLLTSEEAGEGREFWQSQLPAALTELAELRLPFENGHGPAEPCVPGRASSLLGPKGLAQVERLAREQKVSVEAVLLAAWLVLLSRSGLPEELCIGRAHAGRKYEDLAGAHGLFARCLPLRFRLDPAHRFTDTLAQVERTLRQSEEWQEYFSWDDLTTGDAHLPYGFEYRGARESRHLAGARLSLLHEQSRLERFAIQLKAVASSRGLELEIWHDAVRVHTEEAELLLDRLVSVLGKALGAPAARISDLGVLGTADRLLLAAWNDTAVEVEEQGPAHRWFEAQAARTPEAQAVVGGDDRLTYRELNERANRLARHLIRIGILPGSRVVIALERSAAQIVTLLAAWKAGAAFVPVDPLQPAGRLARMLEDVGIDGTPAVVVTKAGLTPHLPATALPVVVLDELSSELEAESGEDLPLAIPGEAPAYVIFTSGSTGRPKGAAIRHNAVANLAEALRRAVYGDLGRLDAPLRVSVNAPLAFDGSIKQVVQLLHGHALVLVPEEARPDARAMVDFVREHRLDVLDCTPAQLGAMLDAGLLEGSDGLPRLTLVGGEKMPASLWERLAGEPERIFYNVYGPTECTVDATVERVGAVPFPSIGRPIANVRAYVMDERQQPVPPEVWGELLIGGAGVSLGYVGLPDLTAERFLPDPFATEPGGRLYRTGDRVRLLRTGHLLCHGRLDHQVKLRGFRIELGEIEAVLAEHPGVARAVAVVREDTAGIERLVAYATPRRLRETEADTEALREGRSDILQDFVRGRLPDSMVPSAVVVLADFPLNRNGKVDRAALPAPEDLQSADSRQTLGPRNPFEEVLTGIWADLLGQPRVGIDESFFDLGGHSLLATQLVSRVREVFRVELPLRALFEGPTIAELGERVNAAFQAGAGLELPAIQRVPRDRDLPLSFAQQRLWFLWQLEPESPAYNNPKALRIRGPLNVAALERTLDEIVQRHEVLRTTFPAEDGRPVQRIDPAARLSLPVHDLSADPDREERARAAFRAEAQRPFDLACEIPVRTRLLVLGLEDHVLLLTTHHIASDVWSMAVLEREVTALYEAFSAGEPSPLRELPVQYADFAQWQREWLQGETLERQLAYWRGQLAGASPVLELPLDRPRPAVASPRGRRLQLAWPGALSRSVAEFSQRRSLTPFMTLLAGFQALLARVSGQKDVSVGTPIAGRRHVEIEALVGFFVNTLVMRSRVDATRTFEELLGQVRETALQAYAHQDLPFERLVDELAPQRSLMHIPLFQVMLILQNVKRDGVRISGLEFSPFGGEPGVAKLDLLLSLDEEQGMLRGELQYRTELFDETTISRFAGHLALLLESAIGTPQALLSDLALLSPAERHQLLTEWNDTPAEPLPAECLHELVERQARRRPEAEAVVCGEERLSYGELDRRANALARRLRELGVGPESLVGVYVERSVEMVVALLGVLKTGGAYVPLDPGYPAQRVARILESASPSVLVRGPSQSGLPEHGAAEVWLDGSEEDEAPSAGVTSANLAYVIYTSGSTGQPKGVPIAHGSVVHLMEVARRRHGFGEEDVWTVFHSFAFDFSVWEIWGALAWGGKLVIVPLETARTPERFGELLERERVTVLNQTPSAVRALSEISPGPPSRALRLLMCGGEAFPRELAPRLRSWGTEVWNFYGPTEATVWSSAGRVGESVGPEEGTVPLGSPLPGYRLHGVDAHGQALPAGVPGELGISGVGLARGYFGDAALTAERFVPDPFGPEPGARLYRTGDLVRRLADGGLEYLGRIDHQVKVRGFRIELGEVEAALVAHPGVGQAVAVVREEGASCQLVAFLVGESRAPGSELRAFVSERVPDYMVPSAFTWLEALPLTPNGKVDRRSLAALAVEPSETAVWTAPRTPAEELLAGIWSEVLGVERVGAGDDFFALGGHSLLATQVVSRVRSAFGVDLPVRVLFETPTVRAVAAAIEAERRAETGLAAPPLGRRPRPEILPLTFAQQRLRFLYQLDPENPFYNHLAVLALEGRLDVDALRSAVGEVVRRHEVLRTVYPVLEGRPVQRIEPWEPVPLPVVDLCALAAAERQREMQRHVDDEARRPFDLESGPVLRAVLLPLAAEEHALLFSLHHIASDAWSGAILVRETTTLYDAFRQGRPSPLPELPVQYADFAVWQQRWLQGTVLEQHLAYWRQVLGGNPPAPDLPTDRPRSGRPGYRGLRRTFRVPPELSKSLGDLSRREGATLFMTLLAALDVLLQRLTGRDDVVVGTAVAHRGRAETEGLIGFFVEMLPLRVDLSGNPRFLDLLRQVREVCLGAFAHQDFPLERLTEELRRDGDAASLFRVVFGVRNSPIEELRVPGLTFRPVEREQEMVRFDLTIWAAETPGGLETTWTFRTDLFDASTIERMNDQLEALLRSLVAAPEACIGLLDRSDEERQRRAREEQAWRDDQAGHLLSIRRRKTIGAGNPLSVAG